MSLHFILGAAGTGKTQKCFEEIKEYMSVPGRAAFLLVPDQETYTAERNLAACFDRKGFIDVTVCGFSRLAHHVFREVHSPVQEALSPIAQELIAHRIVTAHKNELQMLQKMANQPHFSHRLVDLFHRFDMYCISASDLKAAAATEGDTPLGRKLFDLSLLFDHYQSYLSHHFSYNGSVFDLLAREIPKSENIRKSAIWIDGFNAMAPQKIQVVHALLSTAKKVTCTIQIPTISSQNDTFTRPDGLFTTLASLARHYSSVTLTDFPRFKSPRLRSLVSSFFQNIPTRSPLPTPETIDITEGLHLISAPDKQMEADFIARHILTLVRDHGMRYRDMLILLRNPEPYRDTLERHLDRYHIPYFSDQKEPMNNHPLLLLLQGLFRFLRAEGKGSFRGFTRAPIFLLLKTQLLSLLPQEEVYHLENYVMKYHIRYGQWQKEWTYRDYRNWDAEDPPPLDDKTRKEQEEVNAWRKKVLSLLVPLSADWRKTRSAKEKCTFLYEWLVAQHIPETLAAWDDRSFAEEQTRPHGQVWKKVLSLMEEIVHVSEESLMDDEAFFSLMKDGLSSLTFSMIPSTLDHVTVSSMDRGYAAEADVVFIPGASEGDFPKRIEDSGFFTENEKLSLENLSSIHLGNTLSQLMAQEQFYTYLSLSRARKALYISYPETGSDGSEKEPSFLFSQLESLGYASSHTTALPPSIDNNDPSFFASPEQALSLLPLVLRDGIPDKDSPWSALKDWGRMYAPKLMHQKLQSLFHTNQSISLPPALAQKLFLRGGRFYGSVTQLQNYRACPYRYFLQYGLRVEERETGDVDSLDFGNYLHAGLKLFDRQMKKSGKPWCEATDEETENFIESVTEKLTPKVKGGALTADESSKYTRNILTKSLRQSLTQLRKWNGQSTFTIEATEYEFRLKMDVDDTDSFTLKGKIDRVDVSPDRTHAVVYDYKTGTPKADLNDIVNGLSLQLMTYLLALSEGEGHEHFLPAAMMYIYLRHTIPAISVPTEETLLPKVQTDTQGFLLEDASILQQLDKKAGTKEGFISVKYKKDGSLSSAAATLTADQFEDLKAITKEVILRLYERLSHGKIPICPTKDQGKTACAFCPYQSICRFEPNQLGNRYDYVIRKQKIKNELHEIRTALTEKKKEV